MLNLNIKRFILAGDSAGGSLIYAVTLMAIAHKFRVPDALMPVYPTSMQSFEGFWPSMLTSVDESILSAGFTMLAWKAYQPEPNKMGETYWEYGRHSWYISPTLAAPDELLRQFPPMHIVYGSMDPIKDDVLIFTDRLLSLGCDVKLLEIEAMPHGFLNYKMPMSQGMKEADEAIAKTTEVLELLI